MNAPNPYQPPDTTAAPVQPPSSYLKQASSRLIVLGYIATGYFAITGLLGTAEIVSRRGPNTVFVAIIVVISIFMLSILTYLTQAACMLCDDLAGNAKKCRWLAIITGTLFFPWLTWPAYFAAKQLTMACQEQAEQSD